MLRIRVSPPTDTDWRSLASLTPRNVHRFWHYTKKRTFPFQISGGGFFVIFRFKISSIFLLFSSCFRISSFLSW